MQLTEDQVNQLAPDTASIKAGTKIFTKTPWDVKKSERAVWASIKGSGSKPYLTRMDTLDIAFKCSCPSRKFPCKHGLGLAYYIAANEFDKITTEEEPIWVKEWIDKRTEKANKEPVVKKVKTETAIKAQSEDRWEAAVINIQHLELWLQDAIKSGILSFPSKGYQFFENLSKRMIDVKMPGINTYINAFKIIDFEKDGWENVVLKYIQTLHLLVQTIKNHQLLKADFKQELELLLGWNINKNDLLGNPKTLVVEDVWLIVNVLETENDTLKTRKTYLYGIQTNQWATIVEFAFGATYFQNLYTRGELIQAKMAFYPGIRQNRAIQKLKGTKTDVPSKIKAIPDLKTANQLFKEEKIKFPWIFECTQFIGNVKIIQQNNQYYLVDPLNTLLPFETLDVFGYLDILTQSKGQFFDAFISQNDYGIKLLGLYLNNEFSAISYGEI